MDHPSGAQTGDDTGGRGLSRFSPPGVGEHEGREASQSWRCKS